MTRILLLALSLVAALLVLAPRSAKAEDDTPECREINGVIHCDDIWVYGNVRGPTAVYVINRSRLSLEQTLADEDFTQEVVESVDQTPF